MNRDAKVLGTETLETAAFSMLALSWHAGSDRPSADEDLRFLVRTRHGRGWSEWRELDADRHGPDPGSAEGYDARSGTDPILTGESTAVQVRVETTAYAQPAGLQVDTITLGDSTTLSPTFRTATNEPVILTRADWGADESIREQDDPLYGEVQGMFVHHTAGVNDYSATQVPSIIDGIYRYHVLGRGWRDIGYNFLIDKFGRIWEGRYGGIDAAVVGAHTRGYNTYSFGAAILGSHGSIKISIDALKAYRDLIAWKFDSNGIEPTNTFAYPGQETLPTIAGHRDAGATACPGQLAYNQLPRLRRDVRIAMINMATLPTPVPGPRPR